MFDLHAWLEAGGLLLLAGLVFAESGLAVGFFLPGDSLLFVAGFLTTPAGGSLLPSLPLTASVVFVAAVAGDQVGYVFGARTGPALFGRRDSRFFHTDHLCMARAFMDRHGSRTITLARFVPVVRTFAPIVAGATRMHYPTFLTANFVGALLWGVGVTTLGHFLGAIPVIEDNLEIAIMCLVGASITPMMIEVAHRRRAVRRTPPTDSTLPAQSQPTTDT